VAQRHLAASQRSLALSLERLATGMKINRGADNPAGLIVSERLRSEIAVIRQAIDNTSRSVNVIATTEGALNEVSALLNDIKALVVEAANSGAFSDEEVRANQLQIDASIDSISRIANTTEFAGKKLLNGELDYVTSSVNTAELADVQVFKTSFGSRPYAPVTVEVTQSAQQAQLGFMLSQVTGSGANIRLGGPDGIITLNFPASATTNDIASAINARTDATGVFAVVSGAGGTSGLAIRSVEYGSRAFVSVDALPSSGAFVVYDRLDGGVKRRAIGRDAGATINGVATLADGLKISVSDRFLAVSLTLAESFGNGTDAATGPTYGLGTSTFEITGGGALFQLGPQVNTNLQENIGVKSMQAEVLGNSLVGYLSDLKDGQSYSLHSGNFREASEILDEVITQVAVLRGRLGAFERDTLQPNIAQLDITAENLKSSESVIRDTDFAVETAELTRSQILVQAGNAILTIANAQSQNVLSLLGG
jgi:flagellin